MVDTASEQSFDGSSKTGLASSEASPLLFLDTNLYSICMTDRKDTEHLEGFATGVSERYREAWAKISVGPQLEGLTEEEVRLSIEDPFTIKGAIGEGEERTEIPAIVPIGYSGWYNPSFYNGVEADVRVYFAAPPGVEISSLREELVSRYPGKSIVIFYDCADGSARRAELEDLVMKAGLSCEPVTLGIKGEEATLTQFAGPARVKDREGMRPAPQQSFSEAVAVSQRAEHTDMTREARTVSKPISDEEFEQIWDFYAPSFEKLNSGHPLVQSFDRDSLREMLDSEHSITAVVCADGQIVSLAFLSPIEECPWLDGEYYKKEYPAEYFTGNIIHMPTVVTDERYRGQDKTTLLFRELVDVVVESGNDLIFLGECNDFTVDIIPVLADAFFAAKESRMSLDWSVAGVYKYGAIRVQVPSVES